jgi:hypothetical protein
VACCSGAAPALKPFVKIVFPKTALSTSETFCLNSPLPFSFDATDFLTILNSQVLGYNGTSTAYYVRCQDCVVYHSEDSEGIKAWEEWQQEFRDAEKTLKRRDF